MKAVTKAYPFGSLSKEVKGKGTHPIPYTLQAPMSLMEFLDCLEIPPDRVQMVMVNYRAVSLDHAIHPDDRIALFPKEYAIFVDWTNFHN